MVLPVEPEFEQACRMTSSILGENINSMIQALAELKNSLKAFLAANPEYEKALEIVQIPERVLQFRVVWEDDQGKAQVNRGFRVQVRTFITSSNRYLSRRLTWLFLLLLLAV